MSKMGERLKELRRSRGLSQVEVAEAVGIARAYLTTIENNRKDGSLATIAALADYFGVTMDYLYRGETQCGENQDTQILELWNNLSAIERESLMTLMRRSPK